MEGPPSDLHHTTIETVLHHHARRPLIRGLHPPHPAVTRVTRDPSHRLVLLARPRDVVCGEAGELHQGLERVRDERLEGLWHWAVDAARRGIRRARQAVQARGVEAENLPLGGLGKLRIAPAFLHLTGDLKAPERLDLPLWRAIPDRVRPEHDSVRPEVLEELTEDMGAHRGKGDHRRGKGGSDLAVDVGERRRQLRERRRPGNVRYAVAQTSRAYRLQRLAVEEPRLDAGVVDDEVQVPPVFRRLRDVGRMPELRARRRVWR